MDHFPDIQLTFEEARVLGCLLEKEITTPGSYPLTLNSLILACNQSSSREPVNFLSSKVVEDALRGPSQKYLIVKILGGRTPKYEHALPKQTRSARRLTNSPRCRRLKMTTTGGRESKRNSLTSKTKSLIFDLDWQRRRW